MKTIVFFSWQHMWSMKNKAGAPSYHHTISYYIESGNWDVYVFSADSSNKELSIYQDGKVQIFQDIDLIEKVSRKNRINHIALPIKHKHFTKWAVREASKIINSAKDEVVVYGYEVWGVKAAEILSKKYNIPLITRFQGTILSYEKHSITNRIIHYPHYEALETKSDLVIMTDDGTMGEKTLKELGNTSPILFLRNGLDLYEKYEDIHKNNDTEKLKHELNINANEHILLMASRLTSWKRVDRGIKALDKLLEKRNDVRLIIAGDGDSRKSLEALAEKLGRKEKITFLGSIPQAELYRYMLCADVFLSLYDLGNLGNPTFEAMLMRRAIIALNGGDTAKVIHDGQNGVLLEPSEESMIPDCIEKLLTDEKYRNRLAEAAYEFAVKHFYTWKTRLEKEEKKIVEVISQKKS